MRKIKKPTNELIHALDKNDNKYIGEWVNNVINGVKPRIKE